MVGMTSVPFPSEPTITCPAAAMVVPPNLSFEVTAVTEEPAGGSPQPTQQPFLTGKVAAD